MAGGGAPPSASGSGRGSDHSRPVSPVDELSSAPLSHERDVYAEDLTQEDDYADSIHSISTGRPNPFQASAEGSPTSSQLQEDSQHQPSEADNGQHALAQRNSVSKPSGEGQTHVENGLSPGEIEQPQASSFRRQHPQLIPLRTASTVSSSSYATPASPQSEMHGPSHPYAMYPQGLGVSRTTSSATATTTYPLHRESSQRQGPSFPYSMYPQDTSGEASVETQHSQIPVGFPGRNLQFQRRIGAEGEEQDIVGPDGHAEQLPPYSRYPEEYVPKFGPGVPMPIIGEGTVPDTPTQATENQESQEPSQSQHNPPSATSVQPVNVQAPLEAFDTTPDPALSEKKWTKPWWEARLQTRLCGLIPLWFILTLAAFTLISALVCGIVIGHFVGRNHDNYDEPPYGALPSVSVVTITTTRWADATPVSSPTTLAPLPTGSFTVNDTRTVSTGNGCIGDNRQQDAWTCQLPVSFSLNISVDNDSNKSYMSICPSQKGFFYGTQVPRLSDLEVTTVLDRDNRSLGVAYYFHTFYNKLVVVPRDSFGPPPYSSESISEVLDAGYADYYYDQQPLAEGDTAWFCLWNQTYIEGFAAVETNLTVNPSSTTLPLSPSVNSFSSTASSTLTPTSAAMMTTTPYPKEYSSSTPYSYSSSYTETEYYSSYSESGYVRQRRSVIPVTGRVESSKIKFLKIEESRMTGFHGPPVCFLGKIDQNGMAIPQKNSSTGYDIKFTVNEENPNPAAGYGNGASKYLLKRVPRKGSALDRRQNTLAPNDCFCEWNA